MKGMKSEDLISIVDFLYCGVANVYQENLDAFLAIAEDLKLKGLMEQKDHEELEQTMNTESASGLMQMNSKPPLLEEKEKSNILFSKRPNFMKEPSKSNERRIAVLDFVSGDFQELDAKVKSMMEKSQNLAPSGPCGSKAQICKVCGKEGAGISIRDHIEANHLEGVSLPCNICGNLFRSRNQLRRHKYNCFK